MGVEMNYNDLQECIEGRCSHRKFTSEPVPPELIEKLVDCARFAPSGHNLQPWKFAAVRNREIIVNMADAVEAAFQRILPDLPEETAKKMKDYSFFMTHFKDAPVVIVVLVNESDYLTARVSAEYGVPRRHEEMIDISLLGAGAAIQNLLLAAHSLGLGTCWMTEPVTFAQGEIETMVKADEGYRAVSVIAAGWPTKARKGAPKKDLSEVLTIIG